MAEVKGNPLALASHNLLAPPIGLLRNFGQNAAHSCHVVGYAMLAGSRHNVLVSQQFQTELKWVAPRRVRQFIDKAVNDPGKHIAAWSTPWTHGNCALHGRLLKQAVSYPTPRKFIARKIGTTAG